MFINSKYAFTAIRVIEIMLSSIVIKLNYIIREEWSSAHGSTLTLWAIFVQNS